MRFLLSVLIPLVVGATGGAASLVVWTIAWFLYSLFSQAVGLNDKGSFFGMSLMGLPVVGTVCGLSVALVLHKTSLAKQKIRMREIATGWIIGFCMSEAIGLLGGIIGLIVAALSTMVGFAILFIAGGSLGLVIGVIVGWAILFISLVVGGALGAGIGGGVMFWQLSQAEKHSALSVVH